MYIFKNRMYKIAEVTILKIYFLILFKHYIPNFFPSQVNITSFFSLEHIPSTFTTYK